jgi:hypothetical protein
MSGTPYNKFAVKLTRNRINLVVYKPKKKIRFVEAAGADPLLEVQASNDFFVIWQNSK